LIFMLDFLAERLYNVIKRISHRKKGGMSAEAIIHTPPGAYPGEKDL